MKTLHSIEVELPPLLYRAILYLFYQGYYSFRFYRSGHLETKYSERWWSNKMPLINYLDSSRGLSDETCIKNVKDLLEEKVISLRIMK